MKIAAELKPVERVATQGGGKFTIKASAKAFAILSSGLYSNKILAFIRELSCNAYDGHKAAGKAHIPIEVQLPTALNPTFIVKDFGIGLDDHEIRGGMINGVWHAGIYTTFFDSSKADSNDYIGALGLGSKSPFSYTQTFFVSSRFNGIERTYTMFINENGEPEVQLMSELDTQEVNGVTIEIAIKQEDIHNVIFNARKAFMYFDPTPVIKGNSTFVPFTVDHVYGNDKWKIRRTENDVIRGPHVVQGFVSYPISMDQLLVDEYALYNTLQNVNLDLYVEIGDVDIAASREQLSYDKRTSANLIAALTIADNDIRALFQQEIDNLESLWGAIQYMDRHSSSQDAMSKVFNAQHANSPFMYKNQPLERTPTLNMSGIQNIQLVDGGIVPGKRPYNKVTWLPNFGTTQDSQKVKITSSTVVLVDDARKGYVSLLDTAMRSTHNQKSIVIRLIDKRPSSPIARQQQKEIDNIVAQLGNPTVRLLSEFVEQVERERGGSRGSTYKAKAKGEFNVWHGFSIERGRHGGETVNRTFSHKTWQTESIDVALGGLYVPLNRLCVVEKFGSERDVVKIDLIIKWARDANIITNEQIIVGMNEKQYDKLGTNQAQWDCLFDVIKEYLDASAPSLINGVTGNHVRQALSRKLIGVLDSKWADVRSTMIPCNMKTALETFYSYPNDASTWVDSETSLHEYFNTDYYNDIIAQCELGGEIVEQWNQTWKKYPLLKLIEWEYFDLNMMLNIIEYVNGLGDR